MKIHPSVKEQRLNDLPNIGKRIAADLRTLGKRAPVEFAETRPMETCLLLGGTMGQRHDPGVLHTLLTVDYFLTTGESMPWWAFTQEGKRRLQQRGAQ